VEWEDEWDMKHVEGVEEGLPCCASVSSSR